MLSLKQDKKTIILYSVFIFLVLDFLVLIPMQIGSILRINRKRDNLKTELAQFTQRDQKEKLLQQREKVKKKIATLEKKIIHSEQIPTLLAYISEQAKKNGIEIQQLTPSAKYILKKTAFGKFYYLPISINARTKYHNLGRFISQLVQDKYFLEIKKLSIIQAKPFHKVSISIYTLLKGSG